MYKETGNTNHNEKKNLSTETDSELTQSRTKSLAET